jgi:acyl-CoA reductase-like NAD-dependent aldehyde dehydrogenase
MLAHRLQITTGAIDLASVRLSAKRAAPVDRTRAAFGGIKNSGFGREQAELGFGEFVDHKLIHTD